MSSAALNRNPAPLTKDLGLVLARVAGDGLWSSTKKVVPLKLVAIIDPGSLEYEDGDLVVANVRIQGHFCKGHWDVEKYGLMYTDRTVPDAVNAQLKNLGFEGRAWWSEQGAQGETYVDFDASIELVGQFWPQLAAAPAREQWSGPLQRQLTEPSNHQSTYSDMDI